MSDYFCGGLDSDEHGNLIENGFKIVREMDKYKAEAIAHAVSNHDRLADFVKLVANSDTRTHTHKHLAMELVKELGHEI